jgi:hypothetical protein
MEGFFWNVYGNEVVLVAEESIEWVGSYRPEENG